MKHLFSVLVCLLTGAMAWGQHHHEVHCITDEILADQIQKDPTLLARQQASDAATLAYANSANKKKSSSCEKRIIPCVFHIIHDNGSENISDETVHAYVNQVNEVYSFTNIDIDDIDPIWHDRVADMQIELRLAKIDPDGNATDGIVRVQNAGTVGAFDEIKSLSRWDPNRYLNIWIVRSIDYPGTGGGTVLGYAYFPFMENADRARSGIVIRSDVLNRATLPHELGHYLNLYHPFQGGCTTDAQCETAGDRVCDTPPMARSTRGCPDNANTCTLNDPDERDMIENIMDYSDCRSILTLGQKERVDAVLENERAELVSIENLYATGVIDSSYVFGKPVADFNTDVIEVCAGGSIEYSNKSCAGVDDTEYKWLFPSGVPSAAFTRDATVTYTTPGEYDATLIVSNKSGADTLIRKTLVRVIPETAVIKAPFNSDFEESGFPYEGWTTNQENDDEHWQITDAAARNGAASLYLPNHSFIAVEKSYTFTTPEIDLTTANTFELSFDVAYARRTTVSTERLEIYAVSTCREVDMLRYQGNSVALKSTDQLIDISFVPNTGDWQTVKVDLDRVKSFTSVSFRFQFVSNGDQNIYIDNLRIGDWSASVSETPGTNISLYPNPSSGMVNVNGLNQYSFVNLSIRDLSGKLISRSQNFQNSQLDLTAFERGMYLIEFETDKGTFTTQIVRQ